ncbi:glutathione S-transferase [Lujinxingia vulgaris]|uniref:Glutathione S-transferase n=1 Tax=Lujinxingia vulgaris TaxID=2600176 RepID=A0A5C6XJN2_9DELT|nr:glutathione S-transferase family protein [Lujinxingia vulgaris]TXD39140.1 glutathione S-transferase [Lujinxingia vulgaris]
MSYELFISRASPYSMKIAAMLAYLGVEHRLVIQNAVNRFSVIRRLSGRTMVPMLRREDWAINDSTAIARYAMRLPELRRTLWMPPGIDTLSFLLEDFTDEWMVRWAMHSRWMHDADRRHIERLIEKELTGGIPGVGRLVGSTIRSSLRGWGIIEENSATLEASARRTLDALALALDDGRLYLFGDRPSLADFGVFGPLGQYASDPSGAKTLGSSDFKKLRAYEARIRAMLDGEVVEGQATDTALTALEPLMAEALGTYWEVMVANLDALDMKKRPVSTSARLLDGAAFEFAPSRHLRGLLEQWLELVEDAYRSRQELFGSEGAVLERALINRIEELARRPSGRDLVAAHPGLGLR